MKYNKTNTLIIIFLIINVFKIILNKPVEEEDNNSNKKLTYKEINDKKIINKKTKKKKINNLNKNIIKTKLRIISEYEDNPSDSDDLSDYSTYFSTDDSTYFSTDDLTYVPKDDITEEAILFERIDGYKILQNNKISFKLHFTLLKSHNFFNATLNIIANIYTTNSRILNIGERNKNIIGYQYNHSNSNYFLTFNCSPDIDANTFNSIEITEMVIRDKDQNFTKMPNDLNKTLNDINITSLDEKYNKYYFNRFKIKSISDIILKDKLYFNLTGNFENDAKEDNYDIKAKNEKNEEINVTCIVPNSQKDNDAIIACNSKKNGLKKKLIIQEGMHYSKNNNNNNIMIVNTDGNKEIDIPQKKTLSVGAIIGITLAGIVLVVPFIFYIVKYLVKNKDDNNQIVEIREEYFRPDKVKNNRNIDNSKEIIITNN